MEFREALIEFFEQRIPFNAHLGMKVVALDKGSCRLRVPFADHLVGDPFRPALHGGVMSTLADAAGGLAVFSTLDNIASKASTVDLRVDYLRRGLLEEIVCDAHVVRAGNRVAVTTMTLTQQDGERRIAEARGVYNIVRTGA